MGNFLCSRVTVIVNDSENEVQLRECPKGDLHGTYCPAITLEPNTRKLVTATKYKRRCKDSGLILRTIGLYSDGVCFKRLTPEDFIAYNQLRVTQNNDGQLDITKEVRANAMDKFRIGALNCFLGDIREEPANRGD